MLSSKAYTETFYIINLMSEEMKNKIPKKILNNIKSRMDNEYEFFIDEDGIESAELLEDTEKILSVLYTDYLATEEEREIILNKEKIISNSKISNQINNDIEIKEIFSERNKKEITNENSKNTNELLIMGKEKWYTKLFNFIKKIFDK